MLTPDAVYKLVKAYSAELGFEIGAHALRATAATNALDHQADIAKVQEWLGHANISTTRIYDHRKTRPEENNERFIVDRRGEPAVVIMSVQDFIRTTAPPPDWLEKAWTGAKRRGLDTLTPADVDAEIAAHRRKPDPITPGGVK